MDFTHGMNSSHQFSPYVNTNLPAIYDVPLNDEDKTSWHEFESLNQVTQPPYGQLNPLRLDHPFVTAVGGFAISAFNCLYRMHVINNEHNYLHDYSPVSCKYIKMLGGTYYFYITFEAIEQAILGVYESKVICRDGGILTLSKCARTNQTPNGKKAMDISHLSRLRCIYNDIKGLKKDINIYLKRSTKDTQKFNATTVYLFNKLGRMSRAYGKKKCKHPAKSIGFNRPISDEKKAKVSIELMSLKEHYSKAMKGLAEVYYKDSQRILSQDCCRTSNQDGWSMDADKDLYIGLVRRTEGLVGYDYYNPFPGLGVGRPGCIDSL